MVDGFAIVVFDMPMNSAKEIREYNRLKKTLKRLGYLPLQYSIYCRYLRDLRYYKDEVAKIKKNDFTGNIKTFKLTKRQFD